jgi:hypothetical protein
MILAAALFTLITAERRPRAEPTKKLSVALYAPNVVFADNAARSAYVQALAAAIESDTGIPTTGKAYVRYADLAAAKPDFAIIDGLCIAARAPGKVLATATIGGATEQRWALFALEVRAVADLQGKSLAYVKTGCRDGAFLDNALLGGDLETASHFGKLVDRPEIAGAVAAVRDYKVADAVFAPATAVKGLVEVLDVGPVANPGMVVVNAGLDAALVTRVARVGLAFRGGGIDGWTAAVSYDALGRRLARRKKTPIMATPDVVPLESLDVIDAPPAVFHRVPIDMRSWQPPASPE